MDPFRDGYLIIRVGLREGIEDLWGNSLEYEKKIDKAKEIFGPGGEGFMRLKFACLKKTLKDGLTRVKMAVKDTF